jgi:hypothetical protein
VHQEKSRARTSRCNHPNRIATFAAIRNKSGGNNMKALGKCLGNLIGLTLVLALFCLASAASAATYYVNSATGNDATGNGTLATPWKTITHAAATVPAGTSGAPNVISVAAGTYNTASTEVFPIAFTRNFVSLTGAGSATTFIDANSVTALNVDAKGFAVSGFTFENASNAIDISEGGFTVANNIFDTHVSYGVYFYRSESGRTASVSFADMSITGNTFKTTGDGVYVYNHVGFDDTVSGLTATFGNFSISGNTFPLTSGDGINIDELLDPEYMYGGTITVGNFTVTNNTFTGGSNGLDFYSEMADIDSCQATVGNLTVSNNTFTNQTSIGIDLDYWDVTYINYNYFGSSTITLGNLTISDNTITSNTGSSYGIYLSDLGYIYDIYGDSTVTTGQISITNNTVNVDYYGLYAYFSSIEYLGEEYYDEAVTVAMGPTTITGNTITSTNYYGAYIEYYDIAYDTYGRSAVTLGPLTFSNNTVNSYYEALYFYVDYWGDYMYDDSSLVVNALTFTNNTLTSSNDNAFYFELYDVAYEMNGNASVDVKAVTIADNTMTSDSDEALYLYLDYLGYDMSDQTALTMAPITVDGNTISAPNDDAVYIYCYDMGYYLENDARITTPDWIITNNTIDSAGGNEGLYFYNEYGPEDCYDNVRADYGSILIDGNTFNPDKNGGMDYGIYVEWEYQGDGLYGPVNAAYKGITVTDNTFYAIDAEAIYFDFYYFGDSFDGVPTLTMGDIEIGNNTIDTAPYGIDAYFYDLYTEDRAKVTFGKVNIHDNTLTNISDTGIYVYYYNYNSNPEDGATLTIGAPTISGNTISGAAATGDGIYLYVDNSTEGITFGKPVISGNTISGFNQGIYLDTVEEATLNCNYLENNASVGMRFATAGTNFSVNTNSLVGNTVGLSVDTGYAAVINAENNWWGDKLGPAACASCNGVNPGDLGTVDFTPWLTYQPQKSRCGASFPWIMFMPAINVINK